MNIKSTSFARKTELYTAVPASQKRTVRSPRLSIRLYLSKSPTCRSRCRHPPTPTTSALTAIHEYRHRKMPSPNSMARMRALLLHVGDFEGRGLIDRRGERTVLFARLARPCTASVSWPKLVLLHVHSPWSVGGSSQFPVLSSQSNPVRVSLRTENWELRTGLLASHRRRVQRGHGRQTTLASERAGRSPIYRTPVARRGLRDQPCHRR